MIQSQFEFSQLGTLSDIDDLTIEIVGEAFNDHDGVLIDNTDGRGNGFGVCRTIG